MGEPQQLQSPLSPNTHTPSAMQSFKLAFALALVAATVAYASAARQLQQIDIPETDIASNLAELAVDAIPGGSFGGIGTSDITSLLAAPIEGLGLVFENALAPIYSVFGST